MAFASPDSQRGRAAVKKDPRVYLAHIIESIGWIEEFTREGKSAFHSQKIIQDAVIRNFEIMGEAAKRIPTEYREQHTEIPWRMMAAFRDVLAHDYEGVDLNQVWHIIENDLPVLKSTLSTILPPLEELEKELAGEKEPKGNNSN